MAWLHSFHQPAVGPPPSRGRLQRCFVEGMRLCLISMFAYSCIERMEIREYTKYIESEILDLYGSVGWTAYTDEPEKLQEGFEHSLLILAAYEGERLIGLIRVVGNSYTIVWIQDILVHPDYQRRGIGTALLKSVLTKYSHVRQIELATDNTSKTIAFYKSQGFSEMSEIGCCGFMKV